MVRILDLSIRALTWELETLCKLRAIVWPEPPHGGAEQVSIYVDGAQVETVYLAELAAGWTETGNGATWEPHKIPYTGRRFSAVIADGRAPAYTVVWTPDSGDSESNLLVQELTDSGVFGGSVTFQAKETTGMRLAIEPVEQLQ